MITFVASADVVRAVRHAHTVTVEAYVLRPGRVFRALVEASRNGARVRIRLSAHPYADASGALRRGNAQAVRALRRAGAQAALVPERARLPSHIKAALIDDRLYLDDRNWPDDGKDTIVRDDDGRDVCAVADALHGYFRNTAPLAVQKDPALRREARTLYDAIDAGRAVAVETESFGFGRVYAALMVALHRHVPVRLLVANRDISARSRPALARLAAAGAHIRTSSDDEKMAVAGSQAWIGSANASAGRPEQLDWGLRVFDASAVERVRARFEHNWGQGVALTPPAFAQRARAHSRR
ncbi:MAG: hypothetical protein NVS1B14_12140 [Vulcanimicrobiaceae bacterium]